MATQNPISTISYNTEKFLEEHLKKWKEAHIIQAYMYICHKGEDGDKDHIHVRIEPNRRLDPMDLQEELKEYQFGNTKPLGCRPFRPSKEEDWFLYVVHDPEYLRIKYGGGEKGEKIPYEMKEIVVPDDYDLETAFIRAKASMKHSTTSMLQRMQDGANPADLILEGENVYVINALATALRRDDYRRLQDTLSDLHEAYNEMSQKYSELVDALMEKGIDIEITKNGNFEIKPDPEFWEPIKKKKKSRYDFVDLENIEDTPF